MQSQRIPTWLADHFKGALDSHHRLTMVVKSSENGFRVITQLPQLVKALNDVKGGCDADADEKLTDIQKTAEFVQREIDADFTTLRSLAIIGLWSWLETLIKDLVFLWLLHRPEVLSHPSFGKKKVELASFMRLTKRERIAQLISELDSITNRPYGVTRFENLLAPLGLAGAVPKEVSDSIFELQQFRNAIAHNNGAADRRLVASCPWLKAKPGQPLALSSERMAMYTHASFEYLACVLTRAGDAYGYDFRPHLASLDSGFMEVRAKVKNKPLTKRRRARSDDNPVSPRPAP